MSPGPKPARAPDAAFSPTIVKNSMLLPRSSTLTLRIHLDSLVGLTPGVFRAYALLASPMPLQFSHWSRQMAASLDSAELLAISAIISIGVPPKEG
jgi:hypothetical protein